MIIGIDVSLVPGKVAGVGRYAAELVEALAKLDDRDEYILFPLFFYIRSPAFRSYQGPAKKNFTVWGKGFADREAIEFWKNPERTERLLSSCDIVHCTTFCVPPRRHPGIVSTIHDLSFLTHPECHLEANRILCLNGTIESVLSAARIIAVSENTRRDLGCYLGAGESQVAVIPEAANDRFFQRASEATRQRVLERYEIRAPFVLTVGSLEPRKNVIRLVEAWNLLPASLRSGVQLVVAGGEGWLNSAVYRSIQELDLAGSIRLVGYVEDSDLPALYQAATLFVYPSLYEGFGLPVLEAMASGVPVVTSANSSLLEIAAGAARLVNPLSPLEISQAIELLLTDPASRDLLAELGRQRAESFSWQRVAEQTLNLYEEVGATVSRSSNRTERAK